MKSSSDPLLINDFGTSSSNPLATPYANNLTFTSISKEGAQQSSIA